MKRAALSAGALACFALAAGLGLLAADVARWRGALPAGDVRYRAAPEETDLWRPATLVPLGVAWRVLGVEDDLAFRRAVRSLRLGRLGEQILSDPKLALLRSEASERLQPLAEGDRDPERRSRAANLLGVVSLAGAIAESQDRERLLQSAITRFEQAIALDPGNDEAKFNLELARRRGRGIQPAEASGGPNPSPGGSGARGAGVGEPGSGY